jgi:hypothetical protein
MAHELLIGDDFQNGPIVSMKVMLRTDRDGSYEPTDIWTSSFADADATSAFGW